MHPLNIFFSLFVGLIFSQSVSALEFIGNRCEYTQEELSNPDAVIDLTLSGLKFCGGIFMNQPLLYKEINLPIFGKWPPVYPEKAIRQLLKKYGLPKNEPFEPWGGDYREWKVRDKQPFRNIDGYEVLEYSVELLYVGLSGWQQVPGSGNYGVVPVCEKSTVKLYAIKTERGWYVKTPGPGLGYSVQWGEKSLMETHYKSAPEEGRKFIQKVYRSVQDKCKDNLN